MKRCLYIPPPNDSDPSKADALIVLFPGIGLTPDQYSDVAKAIQQEARTAYNQSMYIVVAKFFNNLG